MNSFKKKSRKTPIVILTFLALILMTANSNGQEIPAFRILTGDEAYVVKKKGTELPWSGKYNSNKKTGTYLCIQCGNALFHSGDKFDSQCGWPSFDDEIEGSIKRITDADGRRTEILCSVCDGHLGHVFTGEGFTAKNIRHCVNSVSIDFVPEKLEAGRYGTALFAGGCFWGVEYYLQQEPGVISVVSGYTGGSVKNPAYKEVTTGRTGHAETVKVTYDPSKTTYEKLVKLFLEIHDPTQVDRQGPDIGNQYRSEIFYLNEEQKATARKYLDILRNKGLKIATKLTLATEFYEAEDYHQDYYFNSGKQPYCHSYTKRF